MNKLNQFRVLFLSFAVMVIAWSGVRIDHAKTEFNTTPVKNLQAPLVLAGFGVPNTQDQVAALLNSLKAQGKSAAYIAGQIQIVFNKSESEIAGLLKAAGYTVIQVAKALKNGVNATANQTAAALKSAFNASRNTVASALKYAGYSIRPLTGAEKKVASSVFGRSINLNTVKVTNTLGLAGRPWTTNSPPLYTINVGKKGYKSLLDGDGLKRLLIHELTHVWQGQHGVRFMSNSAYHQALSAIHNGGSTGGAYNYQPGKQWSQYNVEQQASIVEDWFQGGMKKTDPMYPYIRYNVRPGKPNATTKFNQRVVSKVQ